MLERAVNIVSDGGTAQTGMTTASETVPVVAVAAALVAFGALLAAARMRDT